MASVLDLLAEDAGEDEGTAADHVEWASKQLQVHQRRRRTEEPEILRLCLYTCLPDVWLTSGILALAFRNSK